MEVQEVTHLQLLVQEVAYLQLVRLLLQLLWLVLWVQLLWLLLLWLLLRWLLRWLVPGPLELRDFLAVLDPVLPKSKALVFLPLPLCNANLCISYTCASLCASMQGPSRTPH